jgi:hypothetical protein
MKTAISKLLCCATVVSVLALTPAQAGFMTGEFAPANWNFSGPPAEIEWTPPAPADPSSVTVYAPKLMNSITTLGLNPITGLYVVSFRTTFNSMSAPSASLVMNAPGYSGVSLGVYPGDTQPVINNFSLTMAPGDSISFLMTADTSGIGDKKNVPFFTVDEWNVQSVPEPGQWAMMGVTLLGAVGYAVRRQRAKSGK